MKRLLLALCLLVAPAYAADPPPQIKPTDAFAVTLTAAQWSAVIESVRDSAALSARDGNTVVRSIQAQIVAKARKK